MFGLSIDLTLLLFLCLAAAFIFELVNGFHDTANAVATVIYTKTLRPWQAVLWSGLCNGLGVYFGGIAVAVGIISLLPPELLIDQNIHHNIALIMALLITAIAWNLGTWYFGIPASSSHTLIGSILGVGVGFGLLPDNQGLAAINWSKAFDVGLSLLISPLFGFLMSLLLVLLIEKMMKNPSKYLTVKNQPKPPKWVRFFLITTCTGVSFSHGSNDGQKGVGLVMLILIGVAPAYFALNTKKDIHQLPVHVNAYESYLTTTKLVPSEKMTAAFDKLDEYLTADTSITNNFYARKELLTVFSETKLLLLSKSHLVTKDQKDEIQKLTNELKDYTDYAPQWVIIMISLALGIGTMIGWKRIVITIGEKIGKNHMTYSQGAAAEMVAMSTIGVSSYLGLPVSTTHVLSSGIAGSMVALDGFKNLQAKTLKNIGMAWVLTLPVTIISSALLYYIFRMALS